MAATIALAVPGAASAGAIYFHKPMVGRDAFVADAAQCEELAGGVSTPHQAQPYQANLYAVAATALLSGFMNGAARRGMVDNVLRTCMADKGYRRVEASADTRRALSHLSDQQRLDRLFVLAAAEQPAGKLLPR